MIQPDEAKVAPATRVMNLRELTEAGYLLREQLTELRVELAAVRSDVDGVQKVLSIISAYDVSA